MIGPVSLVKLSMSHIIKDNKIYKGSHSGSIAIGVVKDGKIHKGTSGSIAIGFVKDGKIYKGSHSGSIAIGFVKDGKIYKGSHSGSISLKINSTIHSAIKDSKNYDLASVVAVYHFLIKPIF